MEIDTVFTRTQKLEKQDLSAIHDKYYPAVYRYVAYRLEDTQVCEDIASEVFLRLVEALNRRQVDIEDVRAWLLGTASHLISDHLRQKYSRPVENLEDHDSLSDENSVEKEAEQSIHHESIRSALICLTIDQQNVLALRFSQDFSLAQTAHVMGKTVGAVKLLQFRAVESLRRLLEEKWKQ